MTAPAPDAIRLLAQTRGSLLARNVGTNLLGWLLPAAAALVALPVLVRALGDARFGLLALSWTTLGYFGLFDLGLGRAVTHAVGERIGQGRDREVPAVVRTAFAILVPVGVAGSVVLYLVAAWLVTGVLDVPAELHHEAILAFRILAIAIPFVAVAAVLRGLLEARQRFVAVNVIRIPYGVLLFLGPVVLLPWTRSLVAAIGILVAVRVALVLALAAASWRDLTLPAGTGDAPARSLLAYGGWMTVSNVISPLMNTFDQFVIGATLAVGLVTYYATPFELATKLWLFTVAVYPVFFAALATTGRRDTERTVFLFDRMLRLMTAALFLPALVLVALAPDLLGAWLGPAFIGDSARVLQILCIAVFVNCLGQGGLNLIHALGRPDLSGKLHLAELPLYAALLWLLLPRYGIVGAALAWAARAIVDAALLLLACPTLLPGTRSAVRRAVFTAAAAAAALGAAAALPTTLARLIAVGVGIPAWIALVWFGLLAPHERRHLVRRA